ncbi:MAG: hypothetical protein ACRD07_04345 [Acidimicrobiales bacterium]
MPRGDVMGCNTGPHRRKFLLSPGRFLADAVRQREDELVFWGEWEAQSRIVARWRAQPGLPTVLHAPWWAPPELDGERQNTDPWVFGDHFLYSNCKQHTNNKPDRRASALQRLPVGSMILFGSGRGTRFVIDTVFVVGTVVGTFEPLAAVDHLPVDEAFTTCTLEPLAGYAPHVAASTYTLYAGATIDDRVDGMFSFVPCRVYRDAQARFARPAIDLPGAVNPANGRSPRGATAGDRRPIGEVVAAWHAVAEQVRHADLHLGIRFETPPRRAPRSSTPPTFRARRTSRRGFRPLAV